MPANPSVLKYLSITYAWYTMIAANALSIYRIHDDERGICFVIANSSDDKALAAIVSIKPKTATI